MFPNLSDVFLDVVRAHHSRQAA